MWTGVGVVLGLCLAVLPAFLRGLPKRIAVAALQLAVMVYAVADLRYVLWADILFAFFVAAVIVMLIRDLRRGVVEV